MYFSGVPRADWLPAVDARPLVQPEESSVGISSESRDTDVDRTVSPPLMSEKSWGKWAAVDEPAQKKRRTAAAAPCKPGGISLGGDQTTRPRRAAVIEWSDDDENLVAPALSVQTPSRITHVEEQPRGIDKVPKQ